MIRFRCYRRSEDLTPIVKDVDIVRYAQAILADYSPSHLEAPAWFNADHFIEHYLNANVDVQYIYTDSRDDLIAAAAIFNLQKVRVFDKENRCTADIIVPPNTVLIDNWTEENSPFGFKEFTMMHEAGHLLMHQDVFKREPEKGFYGLDNGSIAARTVTPSAALCKRSMMGRYRWNLITSEDFREHQANTFAGAMLMPPRTFIPYVRDLIYGLGYNSGIYTVFKNDSSYKAGMDLKLLSNKAARKFGVSRSAAKVQIMKYGLFTHVTDFSEARRKCMLYMNL